MHQQRKNKNKKRIAERHSKAAKRNKKSSTFVGCSLWVAIVHLFAFNQQITKLPNLQCSERIFKWKFCFSVDLYPPCIDIERYPPQKKKKKYSFRDVQTHRYTRPCRPCVCVCVFRVVHWRAEPFADAPIHRDPSAVCVCVFGKPGWCV